MTTPPPPRAAIPSPAASTNPVNGWTFAALHSAIGIAGLFTRYTVRRWNLSELADSAERVAVELISRAVERPASRNLTHCGPNSTACT